jgi:hypothetical protein
MEEFDEFGSLEDADALNDFEFVEVTNSNTTSAIEEIDVPQHVGNSITVEGASTSPEKKLEAEISLSSEKRSSKKDKDLLIAAHKVHLLYLIVHLQLKSAVCDSRLLQAVLLSLLPQHLQATSQRSLNTLQLVLDWLHSYAICRGSKALVPCSSSLPAPEEAYDDEEEPAWSSAWSRCALRQLLGALEEQSASEECFVMLFVALVFP